METAPRLKASLASRTRRFDSAEGMPNLSNRFARCCLTAACVMKSSSATARVDAGSVNMSRARSGRHRATSTSRSRDGQGRRCLLRFRLGASGSLRSRGRSAASARRVSRRRAAGAGPPRYARRLARCRSTSPGRRHTSLPGTARGPRGDGWRSGRPGAARRSRPTCRSSAGRRPARAASPRTPDITSICGAHGAQPRRLPGLRPPKHASRFGRPDENHANAAEGSLRAAGDARRRAARRAWSRRWTTSMSGSSR